MIPTLDCEKKYWKKDIRVIAGIDEAGRGSLAGPVVAGAVVVFPEIIKEIKKDPVCKLIRDSKMLSVLQREKVYDFISANFPFGVGWSSHRTIDRISIIPAVFLAMKKAISDLKRKLKDDIEIILLDGCSLIPNISIKQENIVDGDRLIFSISAASVVAKVTRDRIMIEFHKKFPQYGFAKHKGYGTELHFERLEEFGPCEVHRRSFRLNQKRD